MREVGGEGHQFFTLGVTRKVCVGGRCLLVHFLCSASYIIYVNALTLGSHEEVGCRGNLSSVPSYIPRDVLYD